MRKELFFHIFGRRAVKIQLSYLLANGGTLANNYMFQPLYRPSLGCTSYYKVTVQCTQCLLLMVISPSP